VNPSTDIAESPRPRDGTKPSIAPVATRVDTDQSQANAWQNESSVRHVKESGEMMGGGGSGFGPQAPYMLRNDSTESHGSPSRNRMNGGSGRTVGVT